MMKIKLFAISLMILSTTAIADPMMGHYTFVCPGTAGSGNNVVSNFGTTIAAYGWEFFNGNQMPVSPYFSGPVIEGSNIPLNLVTGFYMNYSTNYAPATGKVSCNYASSIGFDPFSIAYAITNGKGGLITSSTPNTIDINVPMGLKA